MKKPWHEMTPDERLADRIAKNREIDQRVKDRGPVKKTKAAGASRAAGASGGNVLEKFQEIKRTQGIDAASEFVQSRRKT